MSQWCFQGWRNASALSAHYFLTSPAMSRTRKGRKQKQLISYMQLSLTFAAVKLSCKKEDGTSCCQSEDCHKCNPSACPEDKKKRHIKGQFSAGWTPEGIWESHSLDLSHLEGTCSPNPFQVMHTLSQTFGAALLYIPTDDGTCLGDRYLTGFFLNLS